MSGPVTKNLYGGRSAGRKMVLTVLDSIEASINQYANAFDPCPLCQNKTESGYKEECSICAYYYASQFKAKGPEE